MCSRPEGGGQFFGVVFALCCRQIVYESKCLRFSLSMVELFFLSAKKHVNSIDFAAGSVGVVRGKT